MTLGKSPSAKLQSLTIGLIAACLLSSCVPAKPTPPEDKVCDTVTPGAFGAPVPTSCHPRVPKGQTDGRSVGETSSHANGEGGASTPRQRP